MKGVVVAVWGGKCGSRNNRVNIEACRRDEGLTIWADHALGPNLFDGNPRPITSCRCLL